MMVEMLDPSDKDLILETFIPRRIQTRASYDLAA